MIRYRLQNFGEMRVTVLQSMASTLLCLALVSQVTAQDRVDQSPPAILGKRVFGVTLGQPVSMPPCPVKANGATSYGFDFPTWNQTRETCYWSPELGAVMPTHRGYVVVMYAYDERPMLPGIPVNGLGIFALTINDGKATTFDILTKGLSVDNVIAGVTQALGATAKRGVTTQDQPSGTTNVSWSTSDLSVTYLAPANGIASILFTDRDSVGVPLVNSNAPTNHAAEEAAAAANAAARARAKAQAQQ
jgi:hypothetical protein